MTLSIKDYPFYLRGSPLRIQHSSASGAYYHDLNKNWTTHALTSFKVIKPSMERTLKASALCHLSSNSQVSSHVSTICMQCVNWSLLIPRKNYVLTSNINSFGSFFGNFLAFASNIPSIGIRRHSFSNILFLSIVVSFHGNNGIPDSPLIDNVGYQQSR